MRLPPLACYGNRVSRCRKFLPSQNSPLHVWQPDGLWLTDDQIENAALNLNRFARINDSLVIRSRCNGRTKVAL